MGMRKSMLTLTNYRFWVIISVTDPVMVASQESFIYCQLKTYLLIWSLWWGCYQYDFPLLSAMSSWVLYREMPSAKCINTLKRNCVIPWFCLFCCSQPMDIFLFVSCSNKLLLAVRSDFRLFACVFWCKENLCHLDKKNFL